MLGEDGMQRVRLHIRLCRRGHRLPVTDIGHLVRRRKVLALLPQMLRDRGRGRAVALMVRSNGTLGTEGLDLVGKRTNGQLHLTEKGL